MGFKVLIAGAMLVTVGFGNICQVYAKSPIDAISASNAYASKAMSENRSESASAIAALRSQAQTGLQEFLNTYGDELKRSQSQTSTPRSQRLRAVLDAICSQRDCHASRLYWYTDLELAKAAAKASGKPILSLRLLGRLDEDLSCANSRFFRIALYPNAEVSKVLRDRFILHWQSVRPVPKVTIDFGDGRKLERTLTGNSIHYILDAEGRPIDALPGLYGPQAFLRMISQAEDFVKNSAKRTGQDREEFLRQYHRASLVGLQEEWTADLSKLGIALPIPRRIDDRETANSPTAQEAAPLAVTKMAVEMPILRSISPDRFQALVTATNDSLWAKIGQLHTSDARLDVNSTELMRSKNPIAYGVYGNAINKGSSEDKLLRTLPNFERLIAVDTVRNEYLLHAKIHEWFVEGVSTKDIETLNERVYAQLFLTPSSDPWLGLLPGDAYTAIENEGMSR